MVGQIAAALVLLAGAGLMLRSSRALLQVNRNLHPNSILTMQMVLTDQHYGGASQRVAFYDRMLQRLAALPGVQDATLVSNPPYGSNRTTLPYTVEGQRVSNASEQRSAEVETISPNYLDAFGIPLIRGREFRDSDGADAPGVVIVSESFARRNWPGLDAIGHRIRLDSKGPWLTVAGVVKDVRYDPWVTEIAPTIYQPYRQSPLYYTYIALRTKGDPLSMAAPARHAIAALDIDRPVWEVKTLDRVIANQIIGLSYVAAMLTVLGAIALVLSAVGIYGLMAYSVTERTHELGIRMALGADRSDVLRMVAQRGLLLTFYGLAIGLAISIPLARVLSSMIYGVGAYDAITFGGTALLFGRGRPAGLLCAGLAARCRWIPWLHCARNDGVSSYARPDLARAPQPDWPPARSSGRSLLAIYPDLPVWRCNRHARRQTALAVPGHGIGGESADGRVAFVALAVANHGGGFKAVHIRHLAIDQD